MAVEDRPTPVKGAVKDLSGFALPCSLSEFAFCSIILPLVLRAEAEQQPRFIFCPGREKAFNLVACLLSSPGDGELVVAGKVTRSRVAIRPEYRGHAPACPVFGYVLAISRCRVIESGLRVEERPWP